MTVLAAATRPLSRRATTGRRERLTFAIVLGVIAVVAFLVRLSIVVRGGGLTGIGSYDDGVYYAAADALVHGRLPYRDFLLIQPPLIAVVTAPFAALGTVLSDPTGFAIARVFFFAIGATNAALVGAILRRFGWTATIVGGLGYAVFHPAVYAERSVLLEPLGTLGILLALLLLQHAPAHRRLAVVAGIAAGVSTGGKIWYVVPALLLLATAGRRPLRYLIGVAIGGCAIYLPFLAAAPQRIVQQVVLDQLGRGGGTTPGTLHRLEAILGVRATVGVPASVIAVLLAVIATAAIATALLTRDGRVLGVLAVGTIVVLLLTPSWFAHYTALTAPPLALCLGLAAGVLTRVLRTSHGKALLVAVVVLGVVFANEANDRTPDGTRVPTDLPRAASAVTGCVTADDPGVLIEMDVLSRDLRTPGCVVWPDVTGWTYDPRDLARASTGGLLARPRNEQWQDDVVAFMESGDATIRTRHATGYSTSSKAAIDAGDVLWRRGRFVVHAAQHVPLTRAGAAAG